MNEEPMERWELRLQEVARDFAYPPTPDLVTGVRERLAESGARPHLRRRQLAWTTAILLVVLAGLLAVPQVRAAVLRALRLGAVEIVVEPTPAAAHAPEVLAPAPPTVTPLASVLDLSGETTLTRAEAWADFTVRLPAYPPDLGPPDHAFFQDLGGPVVVLVWLDPDRLDRVRLSLHQLGPGAFAWKLAPEAIQETTVHGVRALWTEGPYFLENRSGHYVERRLVAGRVLIWVEGEITYRLETDLPLEEAVRIAESLRP